MKKNKNTAGKIFIILLSLILIALILYNLYIMYKNIEIETEYDATRTSLSTKYEQTVENLTESSKKVTDMLEEVTRRGSGNFKTYKCRWVYFK